MMSWGKMRKRSGGKRRMMKRRWRKMKVERRKMTSKSVWSLRMEGRPRPSEQSKAYLRSFWVLDYPKMSLIPILKSWSLVGMSLMLVSLALWSLEELQEVVIDLREYTDSRGLKTYCKRRMRRFSPDCENGKEDFGGGKGGVWLTFTGYKEK